jgi:hypothetical protein
MMMNVEMEECGSDFKIQGVYIIVSQSTVALPMETQITRRIFLSPFNPRFYIMAVHVGFMVDKVAM